MPSRALLRHIISAVSLVLVLAGCGPRPVSTQTETLTLKPPLLVQPQHPLEGVVAGVPNFGLISRDVWRGGQPTAEGLHLLGRLGVKTVLDLREGNESLQVPPGVRYERLPVSAFAADQVDVAGVLKAIANCPKPIFVHCREGRDRTGLAIAAYRLSQGMSVKDAEQELRNFHVNWWWDGPISRRIEQLHQSGFPRRPAPPPPPTQASIAPATEPQ